MNRASLERAFSDLVIAAELLDELGPAIHGDGAMFLYGPPGTGKSSVAERIVRAHDDFVLIPYCIEVEGQIISVFDPTLHEPIAEQPAGLDPSVGGLPPPGGHHRRRTASRECSTCSWKRTPGCTWLRSS